MRTAETLQAVGGKALRQLFRAADDRRWLANRYRDFTGRRPNLRQPALYREKLLWLNLYFRDPLVPLLADKYLAREEVARRAGPEVLNELLGVWNSPEEIPFDQLPEQFVLKGTAGSGQNLFCWDRRSLDTGPAVDKLRGWLNQNYYHQYREWCYRKLKPRIIAERLMVDALHPGRSPDDLKVHCFNGEPKFIHMCQDRRGNRKYECFDPQWNVLDLGLSGNRRCETPPPPPDGLDHLLNTARKLSAGFPYVRVDLYRHQGRTIFGEMTWFPFAGNVPINNDTTDRLMGDWIQLPVVGMRQTARRWATRLRIGGSARTVDLSIRAAAI